MVCFITVLEHFIFFLFLTVVNAPNGGTDKNCAALDGSMHDVWNDRDCSSAIFYSVCECTII